MAIVDYSDMHEEIANAPEFTILPKGTEVKVRIIQVRTGESAKNNDAPYMMPVLEAVGDEYANIKEFNDFLWILGDDTRQALTAKQYARAVDQFKKFSKCFDLDFSRPFDPEDDLVGLEGWVIVGVSKSEEYGDQNTVSKYVLPR